MARTSTAVLAALLAVAPVAAAVAQTAPDADAKLKVLRGGSEKTIDLTIGTLEPGKA